MKRTSMRWPPAAVLAAALALGGPVGRAQDEPALPEGLGDSAPALPKGLEGDQPPALPEGLGPGGPPALPEGLAREPATRPAEAPPAGKPLLHWLDLTGFWEVRGGVRTQHDPHERDASLGETRLHLEAQRALGAATLTAAVDLLYDAVLDRHSVDLETGRGWLDLRELNAAFRPLSFMDVKVGRQIITWGTGDLLFINDLFPKDWQAFFIGRDVEYLKAPSDAVRLGLFTKPANLDLVYTPRFDADRFLQGRRLSLWNPMLGRRSGRDAVINADRPDDCFRDDEWAVRVYRTLGGYELAAYGYWGRWKSPAGMDALTGRATFPRLHVYGASGRGQLGKGIASFEAGYYDSRQDGGGDDPLVRNSEVRLLAGYEMDLPRIARDLKLGCQYYLELMTNHDAYARSLPPAAAADECRHVLTCRLTKLLMNQNLTLSLFAYYSPSDSDAYLRPNIRYKIDDRWTVEVGGNVFLGAAEHTFFGQFERNTNVYASCRYGF